MSLFGTPFGATTPSGDARVRRDSASLWVRWNVTVPVELLASMPFDRSHACLGIAQDPAPTMSVRKVAVLPPSANDRSTPRRTSTASTAWPSEYLIPDRS